VRVYDWLDHLDLNATRFEYAGTADNQPSTLVRNPLAALKGEMELRGRHRVSGVVLMSREASPFSRGHLEARILRGASRGVYDFDDALFHDHGQGIRAVFSKAHKCELAVCSADYVIAGNDYLAEWAAPMNSQVAVIPSCIEPTKYLVKSTWQLSDPPRLVWLGSAATEPYLRSISDALLQVQEKTGARVTVISSPGARSFGRLDRMIDRIPWELDTLSRELAMADVGLSPLPDTLFARGKCAYKLLQYAGTGLPCVGSPVGANLVALQRFSGLLAGNRDEWIEALLSVINESPDARAARGLAAASAVDRHYSFKAWSETWRSVMGL
jgi:hypothetical protein